MGSVFPISPLTIGAREMTNSVRIQAVFSNSERCEVTEPKVRPVRCCAPSETLHSLQLAVPLDGTFVFVFVLSGYGGKALVLL